MAYASAIFNAIFSTINNFTYQSYTQFEFPIETYKEAIQNSNMSAFVWAMEYAYERSPISCKVFHLLFHPILFNLINAHNSVKTIHY